MITRNWQNEPIFHETSNMKAVELYNKQEGQIIHMSIAPGGEVKSHTTPVNVAMYVLKGDPTIVIGDEKKVCPAGTMVESPKDIPHAIFNQSEETVRLLVMKLPKPKK
jgi:quercetin dioxygenase-like cupin family protein